MPTQTATIESLIAEYAAPIADVMGLDADDYERTTGGLSTLLSDAADRLTSQDQTRDWLTDAAADLDAIARLGDDGPKTQKLLARIDRTLYEANEDLQLC